MKKKFRCMVCGYVYEGENPPERCPQCKAPASKFVEIKDEDGKPQWACEHHIGDGKVEDAEVLQGLRDHFNGECSEVGMYLAMSRQAEREGYPEIADAFKRYAFEEAEHAAKFAELLGECVWDTKTNLEKRYQAEAGACEGKLAIATPRRRLLRPAQALFQSVKSSPASKLMPSHRCSMARRSFLVGRPEPRSRRIKNVSTGARSLSSSDCGVRFSA